MLNIDDQASFDPPEKTGAFPPEKTPPEKTGNLL